MAIEKATEKFGKTLMCGECEEIFEPYKYGGEWIDHSCRFCVIFNCIHISQELDSIYQLKAEEKYDEAIELLKNLIMNFSDRTKHHGLLNVAYILLEEIRNQLKK
jgi:hypothetical protein